MNYQNNEKFSNELKEFIGFIENTLSKELPTPLISMEYFVLAFLDKTDSYAFKILNTHLTSLALKTIRNTYFEMLNKRSISALKPNRELRFDDRSNLLLEYAEKEMLKNNNEKINSIHLLLVLLEEYFPNNSVKKVFNKAGINYNLIFGKQNTFAQNNVDTNDTQAKNPTLLQQLQNSLGGTPQKIEIIGVNNLNDISQLLTGKTDIKRKGQSAVDSYCIDISEMVKNGKVDNIVGRNHELAEIIKVLCRRKKNNVIVVGESGVGKSALANGLAYLIESNNIPMQLRNKRIMQLNPTAMIGGTQWRGMFEERLNNLINELKKNKDVILFIDDISQVFNDKSSIEKDSGNSWTGLLESGDVQIIATSDLKGYRTIMNNTPSFNRRFQKLVIEEPSIENTIKILNGLKSEYEKFHGVKYSDESIKMCVELSQKYMTERKLPDSAIDIMDEIGAKFNISQNTSVELYDLYNQKNDLHTKIDKLKAKDNFQEANEHEKTLKDIVVKIIDIENNLKENIKKNPVIITKNDVLEMFSEATNIPVTQLNTNDKTTLYDINNKIKNDVIGQDEAIDKICSAIKRNRLGMTDNHTYGTFMLIGESGVGKTMVAKKLAKLLFGDEKKLVRFDLSEYSDKTATNKLIGSNAGYVGYENGGLLTEAIKNKKHCVLLLDEIEKADNEIYNLFLQVFDEGFLTDNTGAKIDFKNVIILATSNVGTKKANSFGKGIGFDNNVSSTKRNILTKELKKKFPPEFLNRFNDIIYFNSLTDENLRTIVEMKLEECKSKLINDKNIKLTYYDCIVDKIMELISEEKEFGARPIARVIETEIIDKITDAILTSEEDIEECIFTTDENDEINMRVKLHVFHDNLDVFLD